MAENPDKCLELCAERKGHAYKRTLGSINSAFYTMLPLKLSGFSTKLVK